MYLYRQYRNVVTPTVSQLEASGVEASFYTRSTAETHQVYGPSRSELPVVEDFVKSIQSDDVVYDIGANAGLYTVFCAVMTEAMIHAFEPVPSNATLLQENLALNNTNATIHRIAVGDVDTEVQLTRPDTLSHGTTKVVSQESGGEIIAEQRSIDSLVASDVPPPNVMKIDVEGYELRVVDGMGDVLETRPPRTIFIELHEEADRDPIRSALTNSGYQINKILERGDEQHIKAHR